MANSAQATVIITAYDIKGNSVTKTFLSVNSISYDFMFNKINIVDATGSFYFGYSAVATITHVIVGGVTTITIS